MSEQEEPSDVPFDAVIQAEDLFNPIQLGRTIKNNDHPDAGSDNAPALPPKSHLGGKYIPPHGIFEDEQIRHAGSILTLNMPGSTEHGHQHDTEVSIHDFLGQTETQDNQTNFSESVKAFFGSGKDCVDAGSEAAPSYEYNMRHKYRGCLIIFNQMNFLPHLGVGPRKGTHEDGKNLERTARKLGFEYIRTFIDLDEGDIFKWVARVARADHSEYDCFAMAVLTHGDEGDILYAHDRKYHLDNLTEPFMARNCPSLAGKPKLFFIQIELENKCWFLPRKESCCTERVQYRYPKIYSQACRGQTLDDGANKQRGDIVDASVHEVANKSEKEVMIIPNAADFLLAFSTVPGYYAWRNQTAGSWFIQALCKCLEKFGDKLELMQIMTRVNRMVAYDFTSFSQQNLHFHGKKQIPSIVTRLTHEVFFRKKKGSRTSSPRRTKHRLPVLEPRKTLHDGTTETNGNSSGKSENKLAGMKETPL